MLDETPQSVPDLPPNDPVLAYPVAAWPKLPDYCRADEPYRNDVEESWDEVDRTGRAEIMAELPATIPLA